MTKPVLYFAVGLPAAGKSTYFSKLKNAVRMSADDLRGELFGDEGIQYTDAFLSSHGFDPAGMTDTEKRVTANSIIWRMVDNRAVEVLKEGKNVIYDGTNTIRRYREKAIEQFKPYAEIHCLWFDVSAEECIKRDLKRKRVVGEFVIRRIEASFNEPVFEEGFDKIIIINEDGKIEKELEKK